MACSSESEPGASNGGGAGTGGTSAAGAGSGGTSGGQAGASGAGGSAGNLSSTGGAGAGGSAGSAGSAGSSGSGGGGASSGGAGGSGGANTRSEGCGEATNQVTGSWVESMVQSGGSTRPYSVWLPNGYDPSRAYPVILLLHGCGSGTNNVPMEKQVGSDAIVVRGTGSDGDCWFAAANGADVPYVDAIIEDVKSRFCADTSALFAVGYSSGSWLANQLGCIRSDVFRGLATVAGGDPGVRNCKDTPIAQMFVHDQNDESNRIEWGEPARDRLIKLNGCDSEMPLPVEPSPCVSYQGCTPGYPVIWCATSGKGHARQDDFAAPAFWKFFKGLTDSP